MKHPEKIYDRIQDPATKDKTLAVGFPPIPDDEPVFLLRATDPFWSQTMEFYNSLVRERKIAVEQGLVEYKENGMTTMVADAEFEVTKWKGREYALNNHASLGRMYVDPLKEKRA